MKTLYYFLILSVVTPVYAQGNNQADRMIEEHRAQIRQQQSMMDRIIELFEQEAASMGAGTDGFFFDSFKGPSAFADVQGFQHEWTDADEGRVLKVTPKNPGDQLDITVENNQIQISGKVIKKEEVETEFGTSVSTSVRSFSNILSVPRELDADQLKVTKKNEVIELYFPYHNGQKVTDKKKNTQKPKKSTPYLKPLKPTEGDITL